MPRLSAKDFAPELLELYDGYVHGKLSRREFLDRAAVFAVGGLTAAGILATLSPDYALAAQVRFTDPDIVAEYIKTRVRVHFPPKASGSLRSQRQPSGDVVDGVFHGVRVGIAQADKYIAGLR